MLIQRTEDIKAALAEAETAKDEAMAKVKQYEAKMAELEKELEEMKANAAAYFFNKFLLCLICCQLYSFMVQLLYSTLFF